jgi:FecR protein
MHPLRLLICSVIAGVAPLSVWAVAPPQVGEVTLTIGQATLRNAAGQAMPAQRGAVIRAGDHIETTAGGHVHVRFTDGALVSVRPASRLVVEDYRYNASQPSESQVRFRLEKGTARAISGAAAENAKDRFRLNTPLVAIGVRGTDFVVQTDPSHTFATVNQGAIVVAPLGDGCLAQTLGPCNTQSAQLLSADMGSLVLEYRSGLQQPEIHPQVALPKPMRASDSTAAAPTVVVPDAAAAPANARTVTVLAQELVAQASQTPPPDPATLVWGRWGNPSSAADFALPREQARAQGQAVVYGWPYSLYRQQAADATWPTQAGKVGFALQNSVAEYKTATGTQPATISQGSLTVDFAKARYQTQLQLQGVPYSLSNISANGIIGRDGVFETRTGNQSVAGAVTFDAQSAAYLFQRAGSTGIVSGITQWGR